MRRPSARHKSITNRRRRSCRNNAGRKHRCIGHRSVRPVCHTQARSTNMSGNKTAYSNRLDNNRCHTTSRKAPLHIRPEKLQRRLRKGSTVAMLDCDAWVSLVFSSDIPFSNIEFPFLFCEAADAAPRGLLVPVSTTVLPANLHNMIRTKCPHRSPCS